MGSLRASQAFGGREPNLRLQPTNTAVHTGASVGIALMAGDVVASVAGTLFSMAIFHALHEAITSIARIAALEGGVRSVLAAFVLGVCVPFFVEHVAAAPTESVTTSAATTTSAEEPRHNIALKEWTRKRANSVALRRRRCL